MLGEIILLKDPSCSCMVQKAFEHASTNQISTILPCGRVQVLSKAAQLIQSLRCEASVCMDLPKVFDGALNHNFVFFRISGLKNVVHPKRRLIGEQYIGPITVFICFSQI